MNYNFTSLQIQHSRIRVKFNNAFFLFFLQRKLKAKANGNLDQLMTKDLSITVKYQDGVIVIVIMVLSSISEY